MGVLMSFHATKPFVVFLCFISILNLIFALEVKRTECSIQGEGVPSICVMALKYHGGSVCSLQNMYCGQKPKIKLKGKQNPNNSQNAV